MLGLSCTDPLIRRVCRLSLIDSNVLCTGIGHGLWYIYIYIYISRVSCQKGPIRHASAWRVGPFWQDACGYVCCFLFRCSGTGKRFSNLKETSCLLLRNAVFEPRVSDTKSPADWMLADKPTELSRIKLKTWTRQLITIISEHSAHSTSLPVGFRTWLWRYTCCRQPLSKPLLTQFRVATELILGLRPANERWSNLAP